MLLGDSGLGDYDRMDGGPGNNSYYVDTGDDLTFEAAGGGTDTVYANVAGANNGVYLYANIENLVLPGTTTFGVGNELANVLTGNASANWLLGGDGNDTINGKAGNDVLFGEGGNDTFVFEHGTGGDVIGDFTHAQDKIDVPAFGFASFAALQSSFTSGADGAIDLGSLTTSTSSSCSTPTWRRSTREISFFDPGAPRRRTEAKERPGWRRSQGRPATILSTAPPTPTPFMVSAAMTSSTARAARTICMAVPGTTLTTWIRKMI